MNELEQLPVDQRAVLALLLGRGMTYAGVAGLLALDAETVRDRALAALAGLAPIDEGQLNAARRGEIGDYLLGQQPASQRVLTRNYLTTSPAARGWARVVAARLAPLRSDLPEIPAEGREVSQAHARRSRHAAARRDASRASWWGAALVLAGLGLIVAVVIVSLANSGASSGSPSTTPPVGPSSIAVATQTIQTTVPGAPASGTTVIGATGATGDTTTAHIISSISLTPPYSSSQARGLANVIAQDAPGSLLKFTLSAQGLAPTQGFEYAVWLYNTEQDALPLGFIKSPVSADGHAQAVGELPANASHYRELVITRETTMHPTKPGVVVLVGPLLVPGGAQ